MIGLRLVTRSLPTPLSVRRSELTTGWVGCRAAPASTAGSSHPCRTASRRATDRSRRTPRLSPRRTTYLPPPRRIFTIRSMLSPCEPATTCSILTVGSDLHAHSGCRTHVGSARRPPTLRRPSPARSGAVARTAPCPAEGQVEGWQRALIRNVRYSFKRCACFSGPAGPSKAQRDNDLTQLLPVVASCSLAIT